MLSCGVRFLEFDDVRVDLSHIRFPENIDHKYNNIYIIFINIKHVLFTNFQLITELSLENIAQKIVEKVVFRVNGIPISLQNDDHIKCNAKRDQSLIIDLGYNSKITIAKQL
ncbi:hypothetical protein [Parapoynx stagnalis nucleopolyhedrovirus]|uniref:Uncharacterized protein n=1 Tax=Parapoynx stagnalis nucleopolyhedrovirus TaxID=2993413 RepID=A0A9E7Y735_9ABAC|nr:hypothetical protein [Parapoynx stagnalis nucleopolyhedrovirus]